LNIVSGILFGAIVGVGYTYDKDLVYCKVLYYTGTLIPIALAVL